MPSVRITAALYGREARDGGERVEEPEIVRLVANSENSRPTVSRDSSECQVKSRQLGLGLCPSEGPFVDSFRNLAVPTSC